MQAAHSTRNPVASFPVAVVELPLLALAGVAVVWVLVVVGMLATEGAFEPPQPARATAAAASSASPPNLRYIVTFAFRGSGIREQRRKAQVTAP